MKRYWIILVLLCSVFSTAAVLYLYQMPASPAAPAVPAQPSPALSSFMPEGALLYVEAKDFAGLLKEWDNSPEKSEWVKSDSHEVFSNSHLYLRLKAAQSEFATAAGLPPGEKFINEAAGGTSALALYDIGKLEMLYITELPSARSMQTALWQMHGKFEPRSAGAQPFFVGKDQKSERVVAFAITDRYLVLGTSEELVVNALHLMAGENSSNLEQEDWFTTARAESGEAGDLRMILDLQEIATSPQFRSYWIQQNITEMQGYSASVSNLYRSGKDYREERVLLRDPEAKTPADTPHGPITPEGERAVADLLGNLPADYGVYRVLANPKPEYCSSTIAAKILSPHIDSAPDEKVAPTVAVTSEGPGNVSELETRIDVALSDSDATTESNVPEALVRVVRKSGPLAMLSLQSTRKDSNGTLLNISTGFVVASSIDWDAQAVRSALQTAIRPGVTAATLGAGWRQAGARGNSYFELDGLIPLTIATRGKKLFIANDAQVVLAMLQSTPVQNPEPAIYAAGFRHDRERENFAHLTHILDHSSAAWGAGSSKPAPDGEPNFFSGNITSLSTTLSGVASESVLVRQSEDKVMQTVIYHWSQ